MALTQEEKDKIVLEEVERAKIRKELNSSYRGEPKSVGLSIVLTILLGPLGLFYSTATGALVMVVISVFASLLTGGLSLILTWPVTILWGVQAVKEYNAKL